MSLFDDPMQLLIVAAIVIVFVMWGPKKIPELAKALGQARGEFAAGAAEKPIGLTGLASTLASAATVTTTSSEAQLIETAQRLGIPTEGKTAQQISDAIVARARGNS